MILAIPFILLGLLLFGIAGVCVKEARAPIVNPNAPFLVALVYALLWAYAFTLSLLCGSEIVHGFIGGPQDFIMPYAIQFFVTSAGIFFFSARSAKSALGRANASLERSAVCFAAFALFLASAPAGGHAGGQDWPAGLLAAVLGHLKDTVLFPLTFVSTFVEGGIWGPFKAVYRWLIEAHGNLFKLSDVMTKVFAVAAAVNFVLGWFGRGEPEKASPRRPLTDAEWENFSQAAYLGLTLSVCAVGMKYFAGPDIFILVPLLCGLFFALASLFLILILLQSVYPEDK
jgi:hypothetical protein